ncbi:HD-GYP domain-containing protein [Curvibacter delicatus]|jgi:putative nucleotidyltransferase with HDIG domain|uniref:HD-GYP domain-containing protein n=1 Tax=Curvibacter delicatus TaxID=80879 RepID=UPI00082D7EC7|nr:HD-GYP domain-containing protein [Curvibacter delicatus]
MLKRIRVEQLVLGMHIKEFCGSWMEHPFWRTSFVITDPHDIQLILGSSIKEVWIDADKGVDIAADEAAVSEVESEAQAEAELKQASLGTRQTMAVPLNVEIERAAQICNQSKQAVFSMFQEVRMGKTVDAEGAQQLVDEISDSLARNASALISLARLKTADDYTYMHSVAVCAMMIALARQLGLDEAQTRLLGLAGLLHDLGKAVMPMEVLNKPGKLTDAEFGIMKSHPEAGHSLLQQVGKLDPVVLDVCLHHHEKTDGSGYPEGLKDSEISLFAKMGAVCDVYDAITSNRPYKSGWDPAESLRKMAEWADGHFDQTVFRAFVKSVGIYPIGSLVRLASGRIGVVIEQTSKSLTTPCVKVFFSTKSNLRIPPEIVDLSHPSCTDKIANREDPDQWHFPDLNELWSGLPSSGG